MPVPIAAKAGVIALSVAVAAAIAVYESPELRRMADDLRRRIAIALHSIGDGVSPPNREPIFNRPEDAEGFLMSRGVVPDPNADVDADEETRRRQREELLYWNRLHLEKKERERREAEAATARQSSRGSSFDDFLEEDKSADKGTYVFNTGADVGIREEGLVRRRGADGVRGLSAALYANPFGDEHGIDTDEHPVMEASFISPSRDETMSDIYNATEPEVRTGVTSGTLSPHTATASIGEIIFDADQSETRVDGTRLIEGELAADEYMTAGQDHDEAYASIQAWAQNNSNPSFYSPLPVSPPAPLSEPEVISEGALTPTYSASLVGSGEDIANDVSDNEGRYYDVMSEDGDIIPTPTSWTEVGSVVSESDAGAAHHA